MKPQITVITPGVDDLENSLHFYRDGLGFPTPGVVGNEFEHGAVVFIELQPGLRLALWLRRSIAHDTRLAGWCVGVCVCIAVSSLPDLLALT